MREGTMRYDVFISHKTTEDGDIAGRLVDSLESHGLKCWIAPRDIPAGQNYASAIVGGIKQSSVFLLLFSRYANQSDDIVREVQQASRLKRSLLTVRLDNTDFSPALSYFLALPQGVGPFARNESLFEGVFEQVRAMIDGAEVQTSTIVAPKPKRRWRTAIAVALATTVLVGAGLWQKSRHRPYPSSRAETQLVNEVIRGVSNLATAYQCAAEARFDFINDAINSLDDPSVAASGALLFKKEMGDALEMLANACPSEDSITKLSDSPIDAATYRSLFDASKQEFEEARKTLSVTIPNYTHGDNPLSRKDRKNCLQQNMKYVELQSQFFALGVIELLQPVSPSALSEFRKHATTYTAIPRLAMSWPSDKEQLDIEQESVMQRLQAIVTQLAAVVGNQNMEYSAERQRLENVLREAGATTDQAAKIIGGITIDAAEKTEKAWAQGPHGSENSGRTPSD